LINYTNEKLQQFFNHQIFKLEQKIYEEEHIDWSVIEFKDNQECLDLIEKRRPAGLLAILDEESKFPRATDESLIEKLHSNFEKKHNYYERPRMKKYHFSVKHFAGAVEYDVTGWRDKNRDELPDHLTELLQSSSMDFVSILYTGESDDAQSTKSRSAGAASPTIEKKSASPSGADQSKSTLGAQFKQQLTDLMAMLGSTEPYFIRCIKPNTQKKPNLLDQKLTYDQLLYAGMLETIRIRRMGYPIRYTLADFWKRYRCICPEVAAQPSETDTATALVRAMGVNIPYECQIGLTKVFFKQDVANDLEDRRLIALTSVIIKCQTWWRMVALRSSFVEKRENAVVVQSWFRYIVQHRRLTQQRRAANLLQAYYRMVRAMRIRAVLAEAKRKAEEARRKKEEEERKKRIAKLGLEQVEAEEQAQVAAEAGKIRALAAGVHLDVDEAEEEAKKAKKAKLQRAASIKMEKLQELEVPINVDGKIVLGLGWTASEWDLDVSILLFRFATHKEDVYFYKPRSRDGAIVHKSGWAGSKRSRFGNDNEHIEINLSKMSPKTNTIIIVATVFNPKGTFSSVQDAYVRLVDPNSDHEFCHYPVPPSSNTANIICKLYRFGFTRWRLKAIGEASGGRVYKHMISKVQPFLDAEPPKRKLRVTVHQGDFTIKYPEGQEPGRKSAMNTLCNISYDSTTEKTKIAKAEAPKHGVPFNPVYQTSKSLSGNANQLEITVLQSKRMSREVCTPPTPEE
jgi:stress response protein SCP2